jgi:hypothetical protein
MIHGESKVVRNLKKAILRAADCSSETFNAAGKTDILIRVEDRNIFVAECKFWKGEKHFIPTIDQLLSYTSWRDTKTAIILFNRQKWTKLSIPSSIALTWNGKPAPSRFLHKLLDVTRAEKLLTSHTAWHRMAAKSRNSELP